MRQKQPSALENKLLLRIAQVGILTACGVFLCAIVWPALVVEVTGRRLRQSVANDDREGFFDGIDVLLRHDAADVARDRLLKYMRHPHSNIRQWSAVALGAIPNPNDECIRHLLNALKDESWDVRRCSTDSLVKAGNCATELLVAELRNSKGESRGWAAQAIGRIGNDSPNIIRALIELESDDSEELRIRLDSIIALERLLPDASRTEKSIQRSYDADLESNLVDVAQALGWLGTGSFPVALKLMESKSAPARECGVRVVGFAQAVSPGAVYERADEIIALLDHPDTEVRIAGARCIKELGVCAVPAVPKLLGMLKDGNEQARRVAAESLLESSVRSQVIADYVTAALDDSLSKLRLHLALRLSADRRNATRVIALVTSALRGEGDEEHIAIAAASLAMFPDDSQRALQSLLSSEDPTLHRNTVRVLAILERVR